MTATTKILLIGGCLAVTGGAWAQADTAPLRPIPYEPGASLYGFGGNGWTAIGDAMLPVVGRPLNFTFIDPQAYYHSPDSQASGSLGVGQRWLTDRAGILGAYVFGDYNNSNANRPFWFVSPGLERLGQTFDFSLNGYIPVSSQRRNTGSEFTDQAVFSGHTQFSELVDTFESTGWGGDVQVGVRLPFRNSRVYLGAYYFDPQDQDDSIVGGVIRAQVPVNNYISVEMSEAYDSQYHNTLKAGLSLALGGRSTGYSFHGVLADRIVDPIQRNLIAVAGGSPNAQPIISGVDDAGSITIQQTNISFFVPETPPAPQSSPHPAPLGAVQGDGTYENPYRGMTQDNVSNANIQNNRTFYVNSGLYAPVYNPLVNPDFIVLDNDQIFGRQNYFTEAAQGAARPDLRFSGGGFLVTHGAAGFTGLQLSGGDILATAGLFVDHETSGDIVVAVDNSAISHFGNGIDIYSTVAGTVSLGLANSTLTDNSAGGVDPLQSLGYGGGLASLNTGTGLVNLNVNASTLSNNLDQAPGTQYWGGVGVYNIDAGTSFLNVNHSILNNNSSLATGGGAGIFLTAHSGTGMVSATITHSELNQNDVGILADIRDTLAASPLSLSVQDSLVRDNGAGGIYLGTGNANNSNIMAEIDRTLIEGSDTGINLSFSASLDSAVSLNIQNSTITNNRTGISANSVNSGSMEINIDQSLITNNSTGVRTQVAGSVANIVININQSEVFGNTLALTASGGGVGTFLNTINVINPVLFDGIVEFSELGEVHFPDVTPSSGDHVVCTPAECSIVGP